MSRSESDDDEFESADEGDESTDESCSADSEEKVLEEQPECMNEKEEIKQEIVDDKCDTPPAIIEAAKHSENLAIQVNCPDSLKELRKSEEVQTASVSSAVDVTVNSDIPNAGSLSEQKFTEDAKINQQKEIIPLLPSEIIATTDPEIESVNETAVSSEPLRENVIEVPPEIANKLSTTRTIPSRGKTRSKPSLGAKKLGLGAVKLNQTPESLIPALAKLDSKETSEGGDYKKTPELLASSSSQSQSDDGGWGWFAPPKSLMSSVSSITNTILSTVENGLNIPEPEDLAKEEMLYADEKHVEVKEHPQPKQPEPKQPGEDKPAGFTQLFGVSNITKFVESTGSSIFSTGLDTLELLGKKTINVLQQSDPGLKRTKAVLANPLHGSQDRPCLSQILREAKEKDEITKPESAQATASAQSVIPTLTSLFELHNGIVHLEALEMLSQQCQTRFAPQIRRLTSQRKAAVDEIAVLCSKTDDPEDNNCLDSDMIDLQALEQNLSSYFDRISLEVSLKKIMNAFREGISDSEDVDPSELYRRALNSLALVTSLAVEIFQKGAELTLMANKSPNPVAGARLEAETFQSVTTLLAAEISKLGSHHANQIIRAKTSDQTNYSTDIYYEASNCRSYLENALKLMIPVLQSRVF
ncbi:hypothetical protein DAPPUDRAFT_226924 [Daphnia pulex]|uniref:Protein FAM114A2 n=1 Tax=Daphnia pulex TaxID=6669 RepID=E9H2D3_DAPPU|nr:hypothetical protein DAPPUDRAFT_226924 [Daphnia pulex]|eukprot:EFX74154.1 hypothetical protein DAPPUDRAFT_226924 [Daphnia pulex]